MERARRLVRWSGAALVLIALSAHAPASDEATLRLEDIVRLHVAGTPAARLIELIHTSRVDFDVSDEMLDELEIAGLSPAVIEAIVARQHELHPPPRVQETTPANARPAVLRIRLADADAAAPALELPSRIPQILARTLGVPDDQSLTRIAVYVACVTATHVPDHWRGESPLGRDFVSAPRHKMLAFLPGPPGDGKAPLQLQLDATIEIPLEPETAHDLILGIAAESGGRFYRLTDAALPGIELADVDLVVQARLDVDGRPPTLSVSFLDRPQPVS